MQPFQSFADLWTFLEQRGLFHIDLALTRMQRALERLDLAPLACVVQVLGTNGKGSTAAFLSSLCHAHGLRVGLYTSPHFVSPRERIRGFPHDFSEQAWLAAANRVLGVDEGLTYFEFMTLLALVLFEQSQMQVAVLEAGLGGAHDATTACQRRILCYTPIALDHRAVLGDSLAAIASDKAQAMAAGQRVFSVVQYPEARRLLAANAEDKGVELHFVEPGEFAKAKLGLVGCHQKQNATLALAGFHALCAELGVSESTDKICEGLARAFLPGRLQRLAASPHYPALILDGAHNPHGMQTMLQALKEVAKPRGLVFACLGDKDWKSLVRLLKQHFPKLPVHFPRLHNARALSCETLADFWQAENSSLMGLSLASTLQQLACEGDEPYLVTGSLYLLGEFFTAYPTTLGLGF